MNEGITGKENNKGEKKVSEKVESLISPEKQELLDLVDLFQAEGPLKEEVKELVLKVKNIPEGKVLDLAQKWKRHSQNAQEFKPRDEDHLVEVYKRFTKQGKVEDFIEDATLRELKLELVLILKKEAEDDLFA